MIELTRHIEILLLDNDCVIVPDFGGFMAHYVHAEYSEEEGMFYQPQRTIGFNPQLRLNDSLLAQSYVEAYDVSYPEAIRMIASDVEEVRQTLAIEGKYEFHGIGTLRYTSDEKYDFEPCMAGLLTPYLYALSSYSMDCIIRKPETIAIPISGGYAEAKLTEPELDFAKTETAIDHDSRKISISVNAVRNVLVAAMMLLLFVFSSIPLGIGSSDVQQCSVVDAGIVSTLVKQNKTACTQVNNVCTVPVAAETAKAKPNAVAKQAEPVKTNFFTIVLASKVGKKGAEDFVNKLKAAGYIKAEV
ncbi:MAG: SPOR domain-containing protein, partial [Prevotella sp.]|nr:SPOR domain-containing protein [Prevotella sp.]